MSAPRMSRWTSSSPLYPAPSLWLLEASVDTCEPSRNFALSLLFKVNFDDGGTVFWLIRRNSLLSACGQIFVSKFDDSDSIMAFRTQFIWFSTERALPQWQFEWRWWNVWEESKFKFELRWLIWEGCYHYHVNLRYVRFVFGKKRNVLR